MLPGDLRKVISAWLLAWHGLILMLATTACQAEFSNPENVPIPVIQVLLVTGSPVQTAWIEWRVPADSAFGPAVRPVDPASVQLSLVLPDSSTVPFAAVSGMPGRFDAQINVFPGLRYRLTGAITGVGVTGETTVPGMIDVRQPGQDTVLFTGSCTLCALPYRWYAPNAAAYWYFHSENGALPFSEGGSTRDTSGVIQLQRRPGISHLTVLALDSHAAAFLTATDPHSSVSGVFGLFGAASRAERWISWP